MTDPGQPGQPYGNFGHNQQGNPPPPYGAPPPSGPPPSGPSSGAPYGGQPSGPPYGGQPSGPPYGAPSSGPPYGPPPSGPPFGAPPPVKKSSTGKVIGIVAAVVVVLLAVCGVGIFVVANLNKSNTLNAKVNDCIHTDGNLDSTVAQEVKNSKIVKCDAPDATYKVVGVVDNKTQVDFDMDEKICDSYPTAKSAMWQGNPGKTGKVLCLAPVK